MMCNAAIIIFMLCVSLSAVSADMLCKTVKTRCVEPGATRVMDGVGVTLDCWAYETEKSCTLTTSNNCEALREKGCSEIRTTCNQYEDYQCLSETETYLCPVQSCDLTHNIICGDETYCMDGDCNHHAAQQSEDFDKAVTDLSAVTSSADAIRHNETDDPANLSAFTGNPLECADEILNFKNCCADTGWGKDMGLVACSSAEKQLGTLKSKGLTVYVGEYCHTKDAGVCLSHHKVYCTFDSKIGRIIQNQGRVQQLHIPLGEVHGETDQPNCRGITPDELNHMNFGTMHFDDIVSDIENETDVPNNDTLEQKAIQRIHEDINQTEKTDETHLS